MAEQQPHALFLPQSDDDEPGPWPGVITVRRKNNQGAWETLARKYTGEELPDEAAIYALWGGGTYHLHARTANNQHFAGDRIITLSGPPRPFVPPQSPDDAAQGFGLPAAPVMPSGGGDHNLAMILGLMMQQQQQSQQMMMGVVTAMSQSFASLGGALAGRPTGDSGATTRMVELLAAQSAQDRRATLDALARLADARQAPAPGNAQGFAQGFELAQMLASKTEDSPIESVLAAFGAQMLASQPQAAAQPAPASNVVPFPPPAPQTGEGSP